MSDIPSTDACSCPFPASRFRHTLPYMRYLSHTSFFVIHLSTRNHVLDVLIVQHISSRCQHCQKRDPVSLPKTTSQMHWKRTPCKLFGYDQKGRKCFTVVFELWAWDAKATILFRPFFCHFSDCSNWRKLKKSEAMLSFRHGLWSYEDLCWSNNHTTKIFSSKNSNQRHTSCSEGSEVFSEGWFQRGWVSQHRTDTMWTQQWETKPVVFNAVISCSVQPQLLNFVPPVFFFFVRSWILRTRKSFVTKMLAHVT